jgi:hypothetical protein
LIRQTQHLHYVFNIGLPYARPTVRGVSMGRTGGSVSSRCVGVRSRGGMRNVFNIGLPYTMPTGVWTRSRSVLAIAQVLGLTL